MVTRAQVEDIMSKYYVVDPPKHLLMLERPTVGFHGEHLNFFKGLQPKWRGDVMILTPQADDETVIHESIHANFGTGELITDRLGKLLVVKHRFLSQRPFLNDLFVRFRGRGVHYQRCSGCHMCQNLGDVLIRAPPGGRPEHYVLMER